MHNEHEAIELEASNELRKSKVEGKKHLTSVVQNFKNVEALAIDCGIRNQPDVSHVLKEAEDAIEEVRQALNGLPSSCIHLPGVHGRQLA